MQSEGITLGRMPQRQALVDLPRFKVARITADSELRSLEPLWQMLWERSDQALPFNAPGWLISWWTHLGGQGLRVYAVFDTRASLIGLLPLFLYQDAGVRRLLPLGISISDYFDGLVAPGLEEPALEVLAKTLRVDGRDWDSFELHELPSDSPFARIADPGLRIEQAEQSRCPWLDLRSFRAAPSRAGAKRRLFRARRRAAASGLTVEPVAENHPEALRLLFRLHAAQWSARGESGVLADSRLQAFHLDAALHLARAGILRMYRASRNGEVAGIYYGFADRRRAYGYLTGVEPAHARDAVGTLLVGAAIEEAATAGAGHFDFLRGQEGYKYSWGAVDHPTIRVCATLSAAGTLTEPADTELAGQAAV